jgi:hypothetical protein
MGDTVAMCSVGTNRDPFIISFIGRCVAEPCPNMIVSANPENVYALWRTDFLEACTSASRVARNTIEIIKKNFITKFFDFCG